MTTRNSVIASTTRTVKRLLLLVSVALMVLGSVVVSSGQQAGAATIAKWSIDTHASPTAEFVDSSGDLFFALPNGNLYVVASTAATFWGQGVLAARPIRITAWTSTAAITQLAMDSAGDLFAATSDAHLSVLPVSDGTLYGNSGLVADTFTTLSTPSSGTLTGVAVDSQDNLYVANSLGGVLMVPQITGTYFQRAMVAGTATRIRADGTTANSGGQLALDTDQSVYLADPAENKVMKTPIGSSTALQNGVSQWDLSWLVVNVFGSSAVNPIGLAVNAQGSIFVLRGDTFDLVEVTIDDAVNFGTALVGEMPTVISTVGHLRSFALDSYGDLFGGSSSGTFLYAGNSILQCAPGYYENTGMCVLDPPGSFTNVGHPLLTNCAPGFYAPGSGSTSCIPAEIGHFVAAPGSRTESPCVEGTYADSVGMMMCAIAPAGKYAGNAATGVVSCPAGSYCDAAGGTVKALCASGTYCPAGSSSEVLCPAGSYCATPSQIASCDPGHYCAGGDTIQHECPAGFYSSAHQSISCSAAAPGNYLPADQTGSSQPLACPAGMVCSGESAPPLLCPGGGYCPQGSASPIICPPGAYCPVGSVSPTLCTAGSYCLGANALATTCPAGTYQPDTGKTTCIGVSFGYYAGGTDGGATAQTICPAGKFCLIGAGTATACPEGQFCSGGTASPMDCPMGSFSHGTGNVTCTRASLGYYVDTTRATDESPCPAGTFSATRGQFVCNVDSPGTYSGVHATSATTCSAGSYCLNGTLLACPAGTYQPVTGQTQCIPAPKGSYVPAPLSITVGATSASRCGLGTYTASTGLSACVAATPGHFVSSLGATAQLACPAGKFQTQSGQSACYVKAAVTRIARVGNRITVTGTNFTTATSVLLVLGSTSVSATPTSVTSTTIVFTLPSVHPHGTVDVQVVTQAGSSAKVAADHLVLT